MNCRPDRNKIRAVGAEFLATSIFTYVGCGSVAAKTAHGDDPSYLGVALAFGLSITALAYTIGHHSGGHINPMVTVAMFILKKINLMMGILYIVAQLLGAVVGAAFLKATVGESGVKAAMNQVSDETSICGAFLMEMILSFLLVLVIAETAVSPKSGAGDNAPIAIGLSVFMAHIVCIPFTGTSINPARSFGPAAVSKELGGDLWLFFVAPVMGGTIAALVARYMFGVCFTEEKKFVHSPTSLNTSPTYEIEET